MKQIDYKIKSSLKYGKVFLGKKKIPLYLILFASLLFPCITIGILFSHCLGVFNLTPSMNFPLIFWNIFSLVVLGLIFWRIIYNHRLLNKIQMWIKDAVLISAKAKRLDLIDRKYKPYQIEVSFPFEKKIQKHMSRAGNFAIGYYKFIVEKEKKIEILYSPKYNEVLILEEKMYKEKK